MKLKCVKEIMELPYLVRIDLNENPVDVQELNLDEKRGIFFPLNPMKQTQAVELKYLNKTSSLALMEVK